MALQVTKTGTNRRKLFNTGTVSKKKSHLKKSNNYDQQQSNSSLLTVHQTMDSNKKSIDGDHILMDGAPKTHSITQVINDHPYRPYFTKTTFGTLTLNQKEARKQLTSQLYKGSTDNILNNIL